MPSFLHVTRVTMIPKVATPTEMKECKHISCNVLHKIQSKILADKLKKVISDLVSKKRSTFIKGRTISDNIFLMHEMVRNCHKKREKIR